MRIGQASQYINDVNLSKCILIEDEDLIILWDGSNAGEILKGKKGVLASTMCKISILDDNFLKDYIAQFLDFKSFDIRRATVGSAIPHVDPGMIENIRIPILSIGKQKAIINDFKKIEASIELIKSKLHSSKALQKSLINQIF